jgi:hypothetical protein
MRLSDYQAAAIDVRSPLNRAHPLALDRRAWYQVIPGFGSGAGTTWMDLTRQGSDGVLTGFTNVIAGSDGWASGGGRPGGMGSLVINGTSGYVLLPASSALNITANITLAFWINWNSLAGSQPHVVGGYQNSGAFAGYGVRRNAAATTYEFWDSTNWNTFGFDAEVGIWRRIVVAVATIGGAQVMTCYRDGVLMSTRSIAGVAAYSGSRALGGIPSNPSVSLPAALDDVVISGSGWTPQMAQLDYQLTRKGNPGLLARVRRFQIGFSSGVVYSGAGAAQIGPVTLAAAGSSTVPIYAGVAAPQLGSVLLAAAGSAAVPIYAGATARQLGAVTLASAGSATVPIYAGLAAPQVGPVTLAALGSATAAASGTLAAQLSSVLLAAAGSSTSPALPPAADWTRTQSVDAAATRSPGPDPSRTRSVLR